MDKADRQKLIMLVLLSVIAGYFGYNGVGAFKGVAGLQAAAAKLQVERDDLGQQIRNGQAMVANLARIKKEREGLELQLKELSRRLPSEHESAQVLRSVESLAGKSGLTVGQVRRRPTKPQELYVEIPMEVSVSGGYHDLIRFAEQLSHLPRLVTLNELRAQTRAAGAGGQGPAAAAAASGSVSALMVAVVFQALPAPGGAAASGAPAGSVPVPTRP
jgi:type IV pilus assembly protein PilO